MHSCGWCIRYCPMHDAVGMRMRNWLPYLLLLVCTRAGAVDMSDAEFYRVLDLDHPGLGDVRSLLAAGDTTAATEALLDYYRRRASVSYFPLSSGGNVVDADASIGHDFTLVGVTLNATRADGGIDWTMSYPGDSEWHWQFHRMEWLRNLARVYGRKIGRASCRGRGERREGAGSRR